MQDLFSRYDSPILSIHTHPPSDTSKLKGLRGPNNILSLLAFAALMLPVFTY